MADQANIIFDDRFTVDKVDEAGKKFDRVSRITANSSNLNMHLTLDIANELYPLGEGEIFSLALARSLAPEEDLLANGEGGSENGEEGGGRKVKRELWRSGDQGLAGEYEYVMYGKVGLVSLPKFPLSFDSRSGRRSWGAQDTGSGEVVVRARRDGPGMEMELELEMEMQTQEGRG